MGASSFSLFLHQNYLAFFSDIDSVAKAVHYLSDTDVLSAYWMVSTAVVFTLTIMFLLLLTSIIHSFTSL